MELDKYISMEDEEKIRKEQKIKEFDTKELLEKKSILMTSIFLGVFGVDRFALGDKIRGIIKGLVFVSLFVTMLVVLFSITGEVLDFYNGITGSQTITWADNVRIVGKAKANLLYVSIAALIGYIIFVVIDGFLCYKKNMKNNYKLLQKQLNISCF